MKARKRIAVMDHKTWDQKVLSKRELKTLHRIQEKMLQAAQDAHDKGEYPVYNSHDLFCAGAWSYGMASCTTTTRECISNEKKKAPI